MPSSKVTTNEMKDIMVGQDNSSLFGYDDVFNRISQLRLVEDR